MKMLYKLLYRFFVRCCLCENSSPDNMQIEECIYPPNQPGGAAAGVQTFQRKL